MNDSQTIGDSENGESVTAPNAPTQEPTKTPTVAGAALTGADEGADQTKPAGSNSAPDPAKAVSGQARTAGRQGEPETPTLTPQDDAALEREVAEALGDMNLLDTYGFEDEAPAMAQPAATAEPAVASDGIRTGTVAAVSGDGLFIDLGSKSQGFLPREELEADEDPQVGDTMKLAVIRYDKRDGMLILSKKTADQQLLVSSLEEGVLVEARVTGTNKGGLELDIKGLEAFMPASQVDIYRIEDFEPLVGQKMICEVTQVEHGDRNIVLSRRNVLEKEQAGQREQAWAELEEGQLRHGTVRTLTDYGAFVDLGGVDGLLHVREMSWARIKHPKDILTVGQGIDVMVIGIDREKKRISLSLRQAGGDPWTLVEQNYPVGSRHEAQVRDLADFGAFAELEPGIDGLIPISQMTWAGRIRHPSDLLQVGAIVEVEVMSVDIEKRRISLSMKNLQTNPWADIESRYQVNGVYPGTVARVADFGAFVTLEPGVDGLVHISELADRRVNQTRDVVSQGQEVQVKILSIDPKENRIGLSIKAAQADQAGAEGSEYAPSDGETGQAGQQDDKKKKKDRPRRGGLSWEW